MVLLSTIFYTNQIPEEIIIDCSLFILSLHALALHLAVKYYFKSTPYEDLSTLALHTSVGCISLQNASRTALCYATNMVKTFLLIFDDICLKTWKSEPALKR